MENISSEGVYSKTGPSAGRIGSGRPLARGIPKKPWKISKNGNQDKKKNNKLLS
jgi:hypothetical protein